MSPMCEPNIRQEVTLGQLMIPGPECLFEDDSLIEAIRKIEEFGYDQFPVIDNEESRRVIGILTSRQLALIGAGTLARQAPLVTVRNVKEPLEAEMLRGKGDALCAELIDYFRTNDFVLVVEDGNQLLGIVQLWDIVHELWNAHSS